VDSISIGLDIGSSAVRAVEIGIERNQRRLRRFGQVGIPSGAVVDGEVVNPIVVGEALRRLWVEGGFSSNKVVLGASGHRMIVRQAEVPAQNEEDLRSSLRFDGQELIPIPMDDATFDVQILERSAEADDKGQSMMRVLIVAAHREMLQSYLAALKAANLEAIAIDASPLALTRVAPNGGPNSGVEALVAMGAELTTIAVRENGIPRFIRSLAVGGSTLTTGIANSLRVEPAVAEALKRGAAPVGSPQLAQARRAISTDLRDLGEDVRATIDFFVSQADSAHVKRLLVTGGASLTAGLVEQLAGGMDVDIMRIDPFALLAIEDTGLGEQEMKRAKAVAATAVGLALWPTMPPGERMSVLPREVAEARKNRRLAIKAAAAVAGVAGVLVFAGAIEAMRVHSARVEVHDADRQAAVLQARVDRLQAETAVHQKAADRTQMVKAALQGDIDWVRVVDEVQAAMPSSLQIQSLTGVRGSSSSPAGASAGLGSLSISVAGTGGLPAVASWLDGLQRDPSVRGTWVSGVAVKADGGDVSFSSNTNLTAHANSNRAQAVKP